jgi:hypothetical protein
MRTFSSGDGSHGVVHGRLVLLMLELEWPELAVVSFRAMRLHEVGPNDGSIDTRDRCFERPAADLSTVAAEEPRTASLRPRLLLRTEVVQRKVTEVEVRGYESGVATRRDVPLAGLERCNEVDQRLPVDKWDKRARAV